eukprot:TRINITY_DN32271_c0_g1_i1.p1 TRINITY_DN32271_c0_g1~~TRINITY_DN32271_c0_g1_i1.p1  ORF type:complete len:265 (+),score=69.08 TRINITY_DN32271_c0_g1_i1:67-861(+)
MSTAASLEKLGDGIAVISLAKEPVNTMNLEFWQQLLATFQSAEADAEVRGVVFQSKLKRNVFTAGLDIKELHVPSTSEARMKEMWGTLTKVLTSIYNSRLVTIAAINGACPAGGCGLALCCDHRIITTAGSMGLNEVALGIAVPPYWCELMSKTIGQKATEEMLLSAAMPSSPKLLELGMVDALVEKPEELLPKALEKLKGWLKSPPRGIVGTKRYLREEFAQRWLAGADWEAQEVWNCCSDPQCIASLDKVIARLSGKAKAKL